MILVVLLLFLFAVKWLEQERYYKDLSKPSKPTAELPEKHDRYFVSLHNGDILRHRPSVYHGMRKAPRGPRQ